MCGIVGYIGHQTATKILVDGLRTLEYRGYDSAGVAILEDQVHTIKAEGRLIHLEEKLKGQTSLGTVGVGHTRWATHGAPSEHNAHPHTNEEGDIALVHNGIIENYIVLKEMLIEKGYRFISETDTEIIVQLIDFYCKEGHDLLEAVIATVKHLEGSFAFAVIKRDEPDKIVVTRKDSPLVLGIGEGENFIASDVPAILKHTRQVHFIEDKEVAVVRATGIDIMDMDQQIIAREAFNVTWDVAAAEKAGYAHFMLKEIYEQPGVIRDTLLPRLPLDRDEVHLDGISLEKEDLNKIQRIYIIGCGTAYYSGIVGQQIIETYMRIPVITDVASEFRYKNPIIDQQTLVILISQSGETADTVAALRMAKKAGAHIIGVVNSVGSTIAREATDILYTWAGPEIAVASTKAYTAQVCAMYLISMKIALSLDRMDKETFRETRSLLYQLPDQVQSILNQAEKIEAIAKAHLDMKNVFYIGRGLDYAVAMEGALKIKEIAYLHAEPYPAGELKHGPIALIEDKSLLIGLVSQERLFEKTVSNMKEVKARGASIVAIALEGNEEIRQVADEVIYIPRTHWSLAPLLANIPQQLFAYYIARDLGHDVDKPRNLAKSVTVE